MAGILDKKQRIMDTLILNPGRYQAGQGHMQFRYVTFTDRNAFYDVASAPTGANVADDASDRIYFEASQRFQDLICPETDLNGMINFQHTGPLFVVDSEFATSEQLYSYFSVSGTFPSGNIVNPLIGGLPDEIIQGITSSYRQQQFLATTNPFDRNEEFIISTGSIGFDFNDEIPIGPADPKKSAGQKPSSGKITPHELLRNNLNEVWSDSRFAHLPNYLFLPPINRLPPGAQMHRVLPFLLMNVSLPTLSFTLAKEALKKYLEDPIYMDYIAKTGASEGDYKLTPGNPGLVIMPNADTAPLGMIQSILEKAQEGSPGWSNPTGNPAMGIGHIATIFDQIDINDFAAARLAFMGTYNSTLTEKYGQRKFTLDQVMDALASKVSVWDPYVDYNAIIGDVVTFPETSQDNNLMMQIYEFPESENRINKLTIIDVGDLADGNSHGPNHRLFYAGKLYENDVGDMCFANIFTIIMHNSSYAAGQGEKWFGTSSKTLKNPKNKFSMSEF